MLNKTTVAVCSDNTITECNHHLECANVKTVGKESCWLTLKGERIDCMESYRKCFDVTSVGHFNPVNFQITLLVANCNSLSINRQSVAVAKLCSCIFSSAVLKKHRASQSNVMEQ